MKKITGMLTGMVFAAAMSVNADPLLYWMVDQSSSDSPVSFEIAKVAYSTDGGSTAAGYLTLVDEQGKTATSIGGISGSTSATWADLAGYTGDTSYTFFIELLSWSDDSNQWQRMGQSASSSYSDLVSSGFVLPNSFNIGTASLKVWTPAVNGPEPSGALLFLIGGSLLALRRRRKAE